MIRIGTNRCGYTGYTCRGIPKLHGSHETVVEGTTITVQHMFNEANELVSAMRQEFDKLPLRIKGMVFAADTINMGWPEGGPHPEVPEISCRYDTDPFSISKKVAEQSSQIAVAISGQTYQYPVFGSTNGWVDLFNACDIAGGTDGYCYRRDVFLEKTLDTEEGGVTVKGHTLALVDNIPAFVSGNTEYIMGPGLLEPMLDTDFDPIDIDTIPAWEAGDDSFIFTTTVLGAWKEVVDDRFRNVYARLNNIPTAATDYNLRDLKREEYENTDCQNFRINLSSGNSLQTRGNQVANLYTVTDGQVAVDDYSVYVSGDVFTVEPAMDYPIYVWVRVYETEGSDTTTTAEIVLLDDSYSIGDELSGGEVIAKEQISVPGSVYRYKYTVQFDDGRKYTGLLFFGFPLPDADDHVVVVGGVRKVFGGTADDSFVLFKIFQTECSPVMNFASDAETGLHGVIDFDIDGNEIITPLPGSTVTPAPGIVQPVVNIALVVDDSTETNTQSTTDVPTVEAVYNFIHGITAYNGPVADAKATEIELSGITGSTVFGEPVDYVIPINKDRWAQNTEDEISGYTAAERTYEAAKAAWELEGEPTEGEIYEAYIEASTIYSEAYYTVYGDVSDGEPGTTYVINNIVLMNGDMMGVAATTAPSVRAVYNFVHDIYALSTPGTVDDTVTPHEASSGTPGTVYTVDTLDISAYTSGTYYADQVPTVKAVMDYVQNEQTVDAVPGILIDGDTTEEWYDTTPVETPVTGIVDVSQLIVKGATPGISLSAVPSVQAVYDFVHGTTVDAHYRALATAGSLDEIEGTQGTGISAVTIVTGYTANGTPGTTFLTDTIPYGSTVAIGLDCCAPTPDAVIGYVYAFVSGYTAKAGHINISSGVASISGATYGIVQTSDNVDIGTTNTAISQVVPTVPAVAAYVNGKIPGNAISGALTVTVGEEETTEDLILVHNGDPDPKAGLVWVTRNISLATDTDDRTESVTDVPTVEAVYNFIHGYTTYAYGDSTVILQTADALATAGSLVEIEEDMAQGSSTVTVITGYTANGTPGTTFLTTVIPYGSTVAIGLLDCAPTPDAVIGYVGTFVSNYKAVAGTISVDGSGTASISGATYGIVQTSTTIDKGSASNTAIIQVVPTVIAVKDYVDGKIPGQASLGYVQVTAAASISDKEVVGVATYGTIRYVHNIDISPDHTTLNMDYATETVVPSVAAVFRFIHARYNATTQVSTALASAATITGTTTGSDPTETGIELTGGTPGTFEVSLNIKEHPASHTSLNTCVPTANAVVEYVYGLGIGHSDSGMITTGQATVGSIVYAYAEVWSPAPYAPTRGTVEVSDRIQIATDANCQFLSHESVPSVYAVWSFVHSTADASTDPNGATRRALAYQDSITIGNNNAEVFGGTPGTVYLADNLKVSGIAGSRTYSAKAVPTVKSVYEFVHGGAETAAMSSPLATPTAMTASTTQPTLTAVPGTMYVADSIEVDSTGAITAPNCVPTAQAVVTYVAAHGGTGSAVAAVRGALSISDNTEVVVNESSSVNHVQGIVNVLNTVKYAKNATRAITPDAVPSVVAVYDFLHNEHLNVNDNDYLVQALANGAAMNKSGTNVTPGTGMAGTVRLATDIKVGSGTTTVPDSYRVVPTAQAVVNWVAEHSGSSPVATVNNFSTAGLVYVADYLPVTGSHPSVTVPTVDAVVTYVQGSSVGGGLGYPNYSNLSNYEKSSSLAPATGYTTSTNGWLLISTWSASSCCYVRIGDATIGLGNSSSSYGMTWLLPVRSNTYIYVGIPDGVIKFDGTVTGGNSNSRSMSTSSLMRLNGITRYDPEEALEDEEEDILEQYVDTSMEGAPEDYEHLRQLAMEAEDAKNSVAGICKTITAHNKRMATMAYRANLCKDHVMELCDMAADYYATVMNTANKEEAENALAEGERYATLANNWVDKTNAYVTDIEAIHAEDISASYIENSEDYLDRTDEIITEADEEYENLLVINVTGGSLYRAITIRANEEADEWHTSATQEFDNNSLVYTSAYAKAYEAYEDAAAYYAEIAEQGAAARVYVTDLDKPAQR